MPGGESDTLEKEPISTGTHENEVEEVVEGEVEAEDGSAIFKDYRSVSNSEDTLSKSIKKGKGFPIFFGRKKKSHIGVGHIKTSYLPQFKKLRRISSDEIHWYAFNSKKGQFERLNKKLKKGTQIMAADNVEGFDDMVRIRVVSKTGGEEAGFVKRKNLKFKSQLNSSIFPFHIDPYNLIAPYFDGEQEVKAGKVYNESNFEWYLNLAILMDTHRALQANTEVEGNVEETLNDIALAALQGFSKTAGILSPKTKGKKLDFKKKLQKKFITNDEQEPKTLHKEYFGVQTTAFFDTSSYWRSENPELLLKLIELIKTKLNLKTDIKVTSDSLAMQAIQRDFPLVYQSDSATTETPEQVSVRILTEEDFAEAIENLCTNIKNGHIPEYAFVFDMSEYYESKRGNQELSEDVISEMRDPLGQIVADAIEEEKDPTTRNLLITHLYEKLKLIVTTVVKDVSDVEDGNAAESVSAIEDTNATGVNIAFPIMLSQSKTTGDIKKPQYDSKKKKEVLKKVTPADSIAVIDKTFKYSGIKIGPIDAKSAMLKFASFEEALAIGQILPATIASKNTNNSAQIDPLHLAEQIKTRLQSKKMLGENTTSGTRLYTNFQDFIRDPIVEAFEGLSRNEDAPPYIKIYTAATADLLRGFEFIRSDDQQVGIDAFFRAKGISNLLQILYALMMVTMESAIFVADNMILFLNQIEKLHNYFQIILTITKTHVQDQTFSDAIKRALTEPPMGLTTEEKSDKKSTKSSEFDEDKVVEIEEQPIHAEDKKAKKTKKPGFGKRIANMLSAKLKKSKARKIEMVSESLEVEEVLEPVIEESKTPVSSVPVELAEHIEAYHQSSAMHALSSTLSATEQQKEDKKLNVLVLKNNYYESVGGLNYQNEFQDGSVQYAKAYNITILDGYKFIDPQVLAANKNEKTEEDKTEEVDKTPFKNDIEPGGKLDIYICDFHHNISAELPSYHTEDLIKQVDWLYDKGYVADQFTIAIDSTIDYIRSRDIQLFLEANKERILSGAMNVVLYRSAQKFDMMGLDNYYGGYSVIINNKTTYQQFNDRIADQDDHVQGLTHQGMAHLFHFGSDHLDTYRDGLIKNTKRLYDTLIENGLGEPGALYVAKTTDPVNVFLDLRASSVHEAGFIKYRMQDWSDTYNKTVGSRSSFGFATANITPIPGGKVRFNPGLESAEAIDEFAYYFIAMRELAEEKSISSFQGGFDARKYALLAYKMDRLKSISRLRLKTLPNNTPIPLSELEEFMLGEVNAILRNEKIGVHISTTDRIVVEHALYHENYPVLANYTIERNLNTFTVVKANQDGNEVPISEVADTSRRPKKSNKQKKPKTVRKPRTLESSDARKDEAIRKELENFENDDELLKNFELSDELVGIQNAGTTCYIASALQTIANTPDYINLLRDNMEAIIPTIPDIDNSEPEIERKKNTKKVARITLRLLEKMKRGKPISASEIIKYREELKALGAIITTGQHDVRNLLNFILYDISGNSSITLKHDFYKGKKDEPDSSDRNFERVLGLAGLYDGMNVTPNDLLAQNFGVKIKDNNDENKWHKYGFEGTLPNTITLNLLKFYNRITADKRAEVAKYNINLLDTDQIVIPANLSPDGIAHTYYLTSFVVHTGEDSGGHYISYVKKGAQWYEVNDHKVKEINDHEKEVAATNAYVLTYQSAPKQPTHRKRLAKKHQNNGRFTSVDGKMFKNRGFPIYKPKKSPFGSAFKKTHRELKQFQDMDKLNDNMKNALLAELRKEAGDSKVSFDNNLDLREMILSALDSNDKTVLKNYKVTQTIGGGFHIKHI